MTPAAPYLPRQRPAWAETHQDGRQAAWRVAMAAWRVRPVLEQGEELSVCLEDGAVDQCGEAVRFQEEEMQDGPWARAADGVSQRGAKALAGPCSRRSLGADALIPVAGG